MKKIRDDLNKKYNKFNIDMYFNNIDFFYGINQQYIQVEYDNELKEVDGDYEVDDFIAINTRYDDGDKEEHGRGMYNRMGVDYFLNNSGNPAHIDLFMDFIKERGIYNYDQLVDKFPIYDNLKKDEQTNDYMILENSNIILSYDDANRIKNTLRKYNKK